MRLVVYGTLRRGGALSYALPRGGKFETIKLSGLKLYVLGGCPGAKLGSTKDKAIVDIWEFNCSKRTEAMLLRKLDIMEGVHYGLYKRSYINTPRGRSLVYTICEDMTGYPQIKDWKEWQKKSEREKMKILMKAGGIKVGIYTRHIK